MSRYLALLRGINVGGKNLIRMAELRECFEAQGFRDVGTYIQSGNVLFTADESERTRLVRRIEDMLTSTFSYPATVVLRTRKQVWDIVEHAPDGFGADPALYRYDVIFLKAPLTAPKALQSVLTREGVDEAHPGAGVLYFRRLISRASQSRLSRIVSLPVYQSMTIRNWKTTTKLLSMMEETGS